MKKLIIVIVLIVHSSFLITDCNSQWVQSSGIPSVNVYSFSVGINRIFAGTYSNGVYYSTNSGLSWSPSGVNGNWVYAMASLDSTIFAGTSFGVFRSTNNGTNWTQMLSNTWIYSILIYNSRVFIGTSVGGVFISTDNGVTWEPSSLSNMAILSFATFGTNILAGSRTNGIYISTNNGIDWAQTSLNNKTVNSIHVISNNIYAGTDVSGVYLSTDNASTWIQTTLNNRSVSSLSSSGNSIYVGTFNYGIYRIYNNGANWVQINEGFSATPRVYGLMVTNNLLLAGTNSAVWRRPLSEITGIQNNSTETPLSYSLSQNYPNPFNPTTKIKFDVMRLGDVKIVVYNITGRVIQTLVNERLQPGTYEASFNGSQISSGVYFYRMIIHSGGSSTDGYSETKRMVLIK